MFSFIQKQFCRYSLYNFVLTISRHLIAKSENFSFYKQHRHAFNAITTRIFEATFLHLIILKNQHYEKKDNCHVHWNIEILLINLSDKYINEYFWCYVYVATALLWLQYNATSKITFVSAKWSSLRTRNKNIAKITFNHDKNLIKRKHHEQYVRKSVMT